MPADATPAHARALPTAERRAAGGGVAWRMGCAPAFPWHGAECLHCTPPAPPFATRGVHQLPLSCPTCTSAGGERACSGRCPVHCHAMRGFRPGEQWLQRSVPGVHAGASCTGCGRLAWVATGVGGQPSGAAGVGGASLHRLTEPTLHSNAVSPPCPNALLPDRWTWLSAPSMASAWCASPPTRHALWPSTRSPSPLASRGGWVVAGSRQSSLTCNAAWRAAGGGGTSPAAGRCREQRRIQPPCSCLPGALHRPAGMLCRCHAMIS